MFARVYFTGIQVRNRWCQQPSRFPTFLRTRDPDRPNALWRWLEPVASCQVFLSFIFLHLVHLLPNLLGLQIYLSRACSSSSSLVIRVVNIVYEYRSSQRKFSCDRVARSLKLRNWKGGGRRYEMGNCYVQIERIRISRRLEYVLSWL